LCTVIVLQRPGAAWPLLLAANRDERMDRPWDPPRRHWLDRPGVLAGRDRTGGGTWMGLNDDGVVAAVLNRSGSLGPARGKRSRGDLPLLALEKTDAASAAAAIAARDAGDYRSFNMVIADRGQAFFLRGLEAGHPQVSPLSAGLHMVTAHDPDDSTSARTARYLQRLRAAAAPRPDVNDWEAWKALIADASGPVGSELNVPARDGFGTVCSSLLALPQAGAPIWLFAAGAPDRVAFAAVKG
jgi:hypothetical protein